VKFRNLAKGNSKQNHEIISKINLSRHCHWDSEQLTSMSPFLEPYKYYTQMSKDVKCGLPLWGQDVLKRILGLTETTIKEDCRKLHNHKLNIGFST
jgi:hypothetical protein